MENGYFGNSGYARLYSDAITDIYKESICYISTLTPQIIPTEVNRNAFSNSLPSSYDKSKIPAADANGNINFKEAAVKIGAAYYDENGNLVFPSFLDVCNYNELTKNGYEQYMKNRSTSERLIAGSIQITPFSDKILYEDTDGDGIPNKWDNSPNTPIDSNFRVINSNDTFSINDIISEEYKKVLQIANENHNTIEPSDKDTGTEIISYLMSIGGFSLLSTPLVEGDFSLGANSFGALVLFHYLKGSGDDFEVPLSIALAVTNNQRKAYYLQLNSFFEMVESTIKPECVYYFATTTTTDELWSVNYHGTDGISTRAATDWFLTFGGARNALLSSVSCTNNANETVYTATILYFVYDVYDWSDTDEKDLDRLNRCGKAKSFRTIGVYPVTITWKKGARYPQTKNNRTDTTMHIELSKTNFDGIDDNNALANAYASGFSYYKTPM